MPPHSGPGLAVQLPESPVRPCESLTCERLVVTIMKELQIGTMLAVELLSEERALQ